MKIPHTFEFKFWKSKQRVPRWARRFASEPRAHVSIDAVVNAHGGTGTTEQQNYALNVIAFVRRFNEPDVPLKDLLYKLQYIAEWDTYPQRRAFARRWLNRITRSS